jgi:hypothetical protein
MKQLMLTLYIVALVLTLTYAALSYMEVQEYALRMEHERDMYHLNYDLLKIRSERKVTNDCLQVVPIPHADDGVDVTDRFAITS